MSISTARVKHLIQNFDLRKLFIDELGWDRFTVRPLSVPLGERTYLFQPVAEKRGFQVFECQTSTSEEFPDSATRRKLDRQVAKSAFQHLLIFTDEQQTRQTWQWSRKESGGPVRCREQTYWAKQSGDSLAQRLEYLAVCFEEEDALTLVDVTRRVGRGFDVEKVTKRFYEKFKNEHQRFLSFIEGIQSETDRSWYASLMLNRLMFIYFIQKKKFLDGDPDYLRNKLAEVKQRQGDGKFHSFYRHFLKRLFHEGLGQQKAKRKKDLDRLLGDVPYLNGGLFDVHELEHKHSKIDIPDEAFERLFDFFDAYQWHLDDRPLREDKEINPDVLGYIFEKYINQKQMGAYYTKEDITGYIARNTIIPFLLTEAREQCEIAFRPDGAVWSLLRDAPDRYIYELVRRGVGEVPPPEIAEGLNDVSNRDGWNRLAEVEDSLPTETWREFATRWKRCQDLRSKLRNGEIHEVNDLISYNLDIRQFAEDVIENCEGPELLRAIYQAIKKVSVLDPTCGSGAFLFAALSILEPLYDACLDRMEAFLDDIDRADGGTSKKKLTDFREELREVDRHPNRAYFILKSIVINNLYGVDIMDEAVEICKLRLFLKLVAEVEKVDKLEPLPDIDFNIRAGNTLVGFASLEEVRKALSGQFDFTGDIDRIVQDAQRADKEFQIFRRYQTEFGENAIDFHEAKEGLRNRLNHLRDELDHFLASAYGVDDENQEVFRTWHDSHRPFHWFVEFYGIMDRGGFDVIIGNPPYVEYSKIRGQYSADQYTAVESGNIYAFVAERCYLLNLEGGFVGLILPLSLLCTGRSSSIRAIVSSHPTWFSAYDIRPSSLFEGIAQRLCIPISTNVILPTKQTFVGGYRRWSAFERLTLLASTHYVHCPPKSSSDPIPKMLDAVELSILDKIEGRPLMDFVDERSTPFVVHRICRYFIKAFDFIPLFIDSDGRKGKSEDYKEFSFVDAEKSVILALINSTLFYWFWRLHGDGFHCGYGDVYRMPYKPIETKDLRQELRRHVASLMDSFRSHSRIKRIRTKKGHIEYQEFYPAISKPIIDQIDRVLAQHYGFTDEELDFIINYDIKYRMGQDADGDST